MPRTFQGRLTLGFISVVSLTLLLVGPAVIVRLDDYFLKQEQQALDSRAGSMAAITALFAQQVIVGPIVTSDDRLTPASEAFFSSDVIERLADTFAEADVTLRVGTPTRGVRWLGDRPGRRRHVLGPAPGTAEARPGPRLDHDRSGGPAVPRLRSRRGRSRSPCRTRTPPGRRP